MVLSTFNDLDILQVLEGRKSLTIHAQLVLKCRKNDVSHNSPPSKHTSTTLLLTSLNQFLIFEFGIFYITKLRMQWTVESEYLGAHTLRLFSSSWISKPLIQCNKLTWWGPGRIFPGLTTSRFSMMVQTWTLRHFYRIWNVGKIKSHLIWDETSVLQSIILIKS